MALPMMDVPQDVLRDGRRTALGDAPETNPVSRIVAHVEKNAWTAQMAAVERIHGAGLMMRLRTERHMLEQTRRAPGLKSSYVGLQTLLGEDTNIDFEDVLADPLEAPEVAQVQVKRAMEVSFGVY